MQRIPFVRSFINKAKHAPPPEIVENDDIDQGRIWNQTIPGGTDAMPAPIASVSVGTTGLRRTHRFLSKMYACGCADRIQSLVVYDCNRTNIDRWKKTQTLSTAAKTILPNYIPLSEGFLRNDKAFQNYYGKIERDLENMADRMYAQSNAAGTTPQVIIEWIGFGGHAHLSYLFHHIIAERFPDSTFLPIICLPNERILERKMREEIWHITQQVHGETQSIITDNAVATDVTSIDHRLAIALASVESAYRSSPESGTLAEIATMFGLTSSQYLGIAEKHLPIRIQDDSIVLGQDDSTIHAIKQAVWQIAPAKQRDWLANYAPPPQDGEQRITVAIPTDRDSMQIFADDILDQLRREDFEYAYPGTKVSFAPANFKWSQEEEDKGVTYAHVSKIFTAGAGEQPSIARIMQPGFQIDNGHNHSFPTRGRALRKTIERMPQMPLIANQEH